MNLENFNAKNKFQARKFFYESLEIMPNVLGNIEDRQKLHATFNRAAMNSRCIYPNKVLYYWYDSYGSRA